MKLPRSHLARSLPAALAGMLALALTACTPAPIYKSSGNAPMVTPAQVAHTPEQFHGQSVIWGGRVIDVHNMSDHTEVEILGYPLDGSQRPQPGDMDGGRFIAQLPGFAEPLDYPDGALVTVQGSILGVRSGHVGQAPYVFPLVKVSGAHVWTAKELRQGHNVHFGIGVGVGIH
ncbi:Slp family lipoprotein [Oleiagrimonas sp. C23AA]|nr:Slp family lipoprotein [Oleiagrimonas sp. C23AA]